MRHCFTFARHIGKLAYRTHSLTRDCNFARLQKRRFGCFSQRRGSYHPASVPARSREAYWNRWFVTEGRFIAQPNRGFAHLVRNAKTDQILEPHCRSYRWWLSRVPPVSKIWTAHGRITLLCACILGLIRRSPSAPGEIQFNCQWGHQTNVSGWKVDWPYVWIRWGSAPFGSTPSRVLDSRAGSSVPTNYQSKFSSSTRKLCSSTRASLRDEFIFWLRGKLWRGRWWGELSRYIWRCPNYKCWSISQWDIDQILWWGSCSPKNP